MVFGKELKHTYLFKIFDFKSRVITTTIFSEYNTKMKESKCIYSSPTFHIAYMYAQKQTTNTYTPACEKKTVNTNDFLPMLTFIDRTVCGLRKTGNKKIPSLQNSSRHLHINAVTRVMGHETKSNYIKVIFVLEKMIVILNHETCREENKRRKNRKKRNRKIIAEYGEYVI